MMKLDLLSAAPISAALLTKSHVTSERLTANANARTPNGRASRSSLVLTWSCRPRCVGPLGRLLRAHGSRSLGREKITRSR